MQWYKEGKTALTFDDVLIRPAYSELTSRQDVDITTEFPWPINMIEANLFIAPIMVANMRSLATVAMAQALLPENILVPAHRFQTIDEELNIVENTTSSICSASIGLHDRDRTEIMADKHSILFLELAHADSKQAVDEIKWIKQNFKNKLLIVGNVATYDGAARLFASGADVCKCGIGSGSICTTRIVTGTGVPQFSAIAECVKAGPTIGDGSIRCSGDVVKCLAAGAKAVMIGSLFAGTEEAAGEVVEGRKVFFGMASKDNGQVRDGNVPEGISHTVPYVGSALTIAKNLLGGIRQGLAMVGAANLKELREMAVFQRVSHATGYENHPHIKYRK